ncbi:GAF domain-containing protein [Paraburkholderia acidisoli]|uniref:histidine kinase n=1 Tax=Paraburkholderia acidisoli TaxID=2571748 RepID=A0A7Z2GPK7_9BURK|nr:GAF domain-containing protein [Paraburkholderia acidisoli]
MPHLFARHAKDKLNAQKITEIVASCDREPIHLLGRIQPHGALLCFDRQGRLIARSANAAHWLGAVPAIGETIRDEHLSPLSRQTIRAALADRASQDESVECKGADGERFDLILHWSGETLIVEFEQISLKAPAATQFALFAQRAIQRLQATSYDDVPQLLQAAAEAIRAMTGFDRVMGYRFMADGSGEVIAEAKHDDLAPYLQQRYPASDIPQQARRLYVLNPIRQISDVNAPPISIEPPTHPQTGVPFDLSHSVLRSVSPIHIEYLRNMGVGASMSISIVRDDKLWGLFACHHMKPYRASHAVRLSSTVLTQVVSILIAQIEAKQRALADHRISEQRSRIAAALAQAESPLAGLVSAAQDIAALVNCEAVAIVVDGEVVVRGKHSAMKRELLLELAQHLARERTDYFVSAAIDEMLPAELASGLRSEGVAGCLAIQMLGDSRKTIVWLRDELVETIHWAGPPDKVVAMGPNGPRLTPRGSFEVWKQTVTGRSRDWSDVDQNAARELRSVLQEVALMQMRESERARTTLLATLGHDLRDPLQAINMAMLLMGRGLASNNDTAKRVEGSTRRMQSLIGYILDVSRIRSGMGLGLRRVDVALGDLLESMAEQARLAHPGMTLDMHIDNRAATVHVDPDRLAQAITNLLGNARKHGDTSQPVTLTATTSAAGVAIEIRNRLLAPPTVPFDRLLDPFKSGSLDNPANRGGLGLGLYIAHAIVKGHEGTLAGRFTEDEAIVEIKLGSGDPHEAAP